MNDREFINRPLSISLDLVRAAAAFAVLLGHSMQIGLYQGALPGSANLQHNAVVIFFVLSGLVIASSTERRKGTLGEYALARTTRILPVAMLAVMMGTVAYEVWNIFGSEPIFQLPAYDYISLRSVILPLLFLSESAIGSGPIWNAPYWSLCYEVWYYALFGAAVYLKGGRRVAWLALLCALAGTRVLVLLPVWLIGVALAKLGPRAIPHLTPIRSLACIAACLAGFWYMNMVTNPASQWLADLAARIGVALKFSDRAITDFAMGLCVAIGFLGLRSVSTLLHLPLAKLENPIRLAAGSSFTLYALHWPLLCLLITFGIATDEPLGFAALLAAICAVCFGIAGIAERNRYALRALLVSTVERLRPRVKAGIA